MVRFTQHSQCLHSAPRSVLTLFYQVWAPHATMYGVRVSHLDCDSPLFPLPYVTFFLPIFFGPTVSDVYCPRSHFYFVFPTSLTVLRPPSLRTTAPARTVLFLSLFRPTSDHKRGTLFLFAPHTPTKLIVSWSSFSL